MAIKNKNFKIAVIEDERFLREAIKDKLEREGFEVKEAINGQEGIKIIREEKPDLILLDLIMPVKSGFEVLEEIKKEESLKDIPVVVLSNLGQESDIEKSKELGAFDYLIKADFKMKEIVEKIKKYFNA